MIRIDLVTRIAAPVERCFDLARSIDLHMASTDRTGEQAIAGITSGLIGLEQEVTWSGRHFGVLITHTSQITEYDRPRYFQDCMVRGSFRSFFHDHLFERQRWVNSDEGRDALRCAVRSLGIIGREAGS